MMLGIDVTRGEPGVAGRLIARPATRRPNYLGVTKVS